MKKLFSSFLVVTALLAGSNAMARNVSLDEAKTAAATYLRSNTGYTDVTADDLTLIRQDNNEKLGVAAGYFFNVADWGFIIMSGSTAFDAVLGFSDCGNLDLDKMPEAMNDWVGGYINAVRDVQLADVTENFDDTDEWEVLLSGTALPTKDEPTVILMSEKWDQGTPNGNDYNLYCPVVNGERCYVGCVATALAQIVHYYRYPTSPKGRKSYRTETHNIQITVKFDTVNFDYSKMPNTISSTTSMEKRREVSKLGYMCGVAVGMNYTPEGSGASTADVPNAMYKFFKYERGTIMYRTASFPHEAYATTTSGNTVYLDDLINSSAYSYLGYYGNDYDESTYLGAILDEINHNRPVYMSASSSGGGSDRDAAGHAFVVCGHRGGDLSKKYYFNWGWGGYGNGWFNLDANNMPISGGMGNYNRRQGVVVGMVPQYADSTDIDFMAIDRVEESAVELQAAYPNPATYSVTIPYRLSSAADMFIYSMDGRLVEQRRLEAGDDNVEVRVDRLPAGIYIYRVNGACGKFMVQ